MSHAENLASLDILRTRALAGDKHAESALFAELRVRFLTVTKHRVQPDHLEDVVQETLGVVLRKYGDLAPDRGILVWSLAVLRNVIGNHYQSRRRHNAQTVQVEDWRKVPTAALVTDPVDGLAADETAARLEAAITELARTAPRCGTIFARLLESMEQGGGPRDISTRAMALVQTEIPDLTRNSFYVALHRCRARLRNLLQRMEGSNV